jgi:116 kDa U5 small nuclear ribonucleoprotein component
VVVVGHLHHGKTALLDMLVYETHKIDWDTDRQVRIGMVFSFTLVTEQCFVLQLRYTDTSIISQARGISLKSSPMSLVLSSTRGKSYLVNLIDTPGHVAFHVRV